MLWLVPLPVAAIGLFLLIVFLSSFSYATIGTKIRDWECQEGTGAYLFDSVAFDTITLTGTCTWVSGHNAGHPNAINIANANSYGRGTYNGYGLNGLNTWTMICWVKFDSLPAADISRFLSIQQTEPTEVGISGDVGEYSYFSSYDSDGHAVATFLNPVSPVFTTGVWYHMAWVWDKDGYQYIYRNGVELGKTALNGHAFATYNNVGYWFNYFSPDATHGLAGAIDDLRIYDGAWTVAQINNDFNPPVSSTNICHVLILKRNDLEENSLWQTGDIVMQRNEENFKGWGDMELNTDVFLTTKITGNSTCYMSCLMDGTTLQKNREYQVYIASITAEMTCADFQNSLNKK